MKFVFWILFTLSLFFSGCASIVSKSDWPVSIQSNPSGANVGILDENGIVVASGKTPAIITLSAKSGYMQPAKYRFKFYKEGYQETVCSHSARFNGWYVGNIVFGGLIGMLLVDPVTGAMWRIPGPVQVDLVEASGPPSAQEAQLQAQ